MTSSAGFPGSAVANTTAGEGRTIPCSTLARNNLFPWGFGRSRVTVLLPFLLCRWMDGLGIESSYDNGLLVYELPSMTDLTEELQKIYLIDLTYFLLENSSSLLVTIVIAHGQLYG